MDLKTNTLGITFTACLDVELWLEKGVLALILALFWPYLHIQEGYEGVVKCKRRPSIGRFQVD